MAQLSCSVNQAFLLSTTFLRLVHFTAFSKLHSNQTASNLAPLFNTTLGKLYGYCQANKISAPAYNQKNTSITKQKSSTTRAVLEKRPAASAEDSLKWRLQMALCWLRAAVEGHRENGRSVVRLTRARSTTSGMWSVSMRGLIRTLRKDISLDQSAR